MTENLTSNRGLCNEAAGKVYFNMFLRIAAFELDLQHGPLGHSKIWHELDILGATEHNLSGQNQGAIAANMITTHINSRLNGS